MTSESGKIIPGTVAEDYLQKAESISPSYARYSLIFPLPCRQLIGESIFSYES